jgi:tetratricopeptide (TPR) repeat protein
VGPAVRTIFVNIPGPTLRPQGLRYEVAKVPNPGSARSPCTTYVHNPSMNDKNPLILETPTPGELTQLVTLINSGRHIEAEQTAREQLTRDPNSGFLWKALGLCLWAQGKNARVALQNATKLCPNDAEAHSNLGNALMEIGELEQALESCTRALDIKPDFAEAHNNLGNALRRLGKINDAIVSYRRALDLRPDFATAHNNLGSALRSLGKLDDAIVSYRRALEIQPGSAAAHNNLGTALRDLRRFDEATECYRRALQLKHDYAEAHNNLGTTLLDLGQAEAAAASYRRALEFRHDYAEAHSNLGNALRILGELDDAVTSCRKALQVREPFAEAHNNLGNALRALKQFEPALASYRRALELNPQFAEAHANAGDAYLDLGHLDEAATSYRRALAIKADYAEAHGKLANVLRHQWQFSDSAESCRLALAIKPDYAEAHNSLGCALMDLVHLREAAANFRQALQLKPDYAEAHNNLAYVLRLQGQTIEAETSCRRALELDPGLMSAVALLAELHADKGQFEEAEHLYQQAISIDPDSPLPWAGIPHLRRMTRGDSAWLSAAQRIVDRHPPPRQEVTLRCALGKYFNDVKEFEQAFSNYDRAQKLTKLHRPVYAQYDRQVHQRRIDNIIRLYDRSWLDITRPNSNPSPRPVFIVGLRRTGTTLAEQILASHPAVFGAGTRDYWSNIALEHEPRIESGDGDKNIITKLASDYLQLLDEISPDALRIVDKMTTNFMCLGLIHAALPNARFIHMRRNPFDTCLANYFVAFNVANDLEDWAHYYKEYSRLMEHWRLTLPNDIVLDVPYESLVDNQEAWSRKMLDFIGLPWDTRCLDFQRTPRSIVTDSRWQVRQEMHRGSVERWRNYAKFLEPLLRSLQVPTPNETAATK